MVEGDFKDQVWKARKDAHQLHHRIADFVLHADERIHPPKLAKLVAQYREMMDGADKITPSVYARSPVPIVDGPS